MGLMYDIQEMEPVIRRWARRHEHWLSNYDYEELVQVGLIELWRCYDTYNPELGASISTYWTRRMNYWIGSHYRDERKRRVKVSSWDMTDGNVLHYLEEIDNDNHIIADSCYMSAYRRELYKAIYNALGCLTPRQADVIRLILAGYERAEIAEILGISTLTVGSMRHKALQRLRHSSLQYYVD